jgi:guanylate kinase
MTRGTLFVISAPSGTGKSTIISEIRTIFPDMLYSVSCTTRQPRNGEAEGLDYYFVDKDEFRSMAQQERFLEWKEVHGNFYGTPREPITKAMNSGRKMILDIDVQGALEVFGKVEEAVGIFVSPPDLDELERRLRLRATDSESSIKERLNNAPKEMALASRFKYQTINRFIDQAVDELASIIRSECRCDLKDH